MILPYLKLGFPNYAGLEIGITGLQDPHYGGPKSECMKPLGQKREQMFKALHSLYNKEKSNVKDCLSS